MTGRELLAGRYELRGLLGRGGMAEVRDGWDTRLCRPVAVKVLHPHMADDPELRRRFEVEAKAAAALEHPNVVAVHDFGEHDGAPFIVMERLPGRTLHDMMGAGPMAPHQVRAILDDVLAGLNVAHAAGVLHRDVKPGNVLVSSSGDRMKVADFGIAKTGGGAETKTGQIIGTLCYMSPERVTGAPASVADDLYAVAVIGYEALVGHRAFPHDNPVALARAIIDTPPPPLSQMRTDIDPALAAVITRGMARDPAHRFGGADHMRAALAGDPAALAAPRPVAAAPRPATRVMATPLPPTAGYPPPPPVRATRGRRNPRRVILAGAAIAAAFVVSALALALDPFSSSPSPASVTTSTSVTPPPTPPPTEPSSATPVTSAPPPAVAPAPAPEPRGGGPGPGHGNGNGHGNGKKDKP
ncbi:serine/threonine-protein kinase [Mycobacterium sp. PSTR-4-N]|uniref:serine/threonine-protein kinase n=1 Tax=Mycobacterium sp. PSTR-4-N TaxID=2917745 RepID=UPI001F150E48|nr:serine/threonine-protein kinase [Mycobacterium sp. PSTR-4-N]MCG7594455.1 serine/threonine protein kinase [Mycobacterium sp. PSTR-4-N]